METQCIKSLEPIYVIGHAKPDVDSIVSSKLLADIFNDCGIKSYYAILEDDYDLDEYNLHMVNECMDFNPVIIKKKDILAHNYILVDHNNPIQSIGDLANIIGCIDHHQDSGKIKNTNITNYCCTALSIYEQFKNDYSFSTEQKYQIYMAFLSDSIFTKSSRYRPEDGLLIQELGFSADYKEQFEKHFIPTNTEEGIEKVFHNGHKKYKFGDIEFESSYIETFGTNQLPSYVNLIKKQPGSFFGLWADHEEDKTYVYLKHKRNLAVFNYDFIASRATTVMDDVLEYLDINPKTLIKR